MVANLLVEIWSGKNVEEQGETGEKNVEEQGETGEKNVEEQGETGEKEGKETLEEERVRGDCVKLINIHIVI